MSELSDLPTIKGINIDEFDGKETTVEVVELLDVEHKFDEPSRQVIIKTANLGDEEFELRASEYIPLKFDKKNKVWGLPENSNAKAQKVLKFFGTKNLEEIKGKKCRVCKRIKGDREFLGIHIG